MGDFHDANYNITKIRTSGGDVAELELNGKPVALASDVDLENNKTATIDVSTYTEPVEITPTAGKDGMKKATITLSNIPEADIDGIYVAYAGFYNTVFIFLSTTSLTNIKAYNGSETTLETALEDTDGWESWSESSTFSSYVNNICNTVLENSITDSFVQFTSGNDSYAFDINDITHLFTKLTKIN